MSMKHRGNDVVWVSCSGEPLLLDEETGVAETAAKAAQNSDVQGFMMLYARGI